MINFFSSSGLLKPNFIIFLVTLTQNRCVPTIDASFQKLIVSFTASLRIHFIRLRPHHPSPSNPTLSSKWCWCESLPHIHLRGNSTANQPGTSLSIQPYAYRSYTSPPSSLTLQLQAIFADSAIVCPLVKASFSRCYDSAKTACLTLCYNKRKFMPHPILCQYGIGRMVVHIAKSSRNYIIRGHCQKLIIEIYT